MTARSATARQGTGVPCARAGPASPSDPAGPSPGPIMSSTDRESAEDGTEAATILVVDDEEPIRRLIDFPLRRDGHKVVTAASGAEALRAFERHHPDLVLLDVMLPGIDGLEVCRRLRERSAVPILMLSARADEDDRVAGLEIGADDYVTKPFSVRELRSRVRAALRRTALARHREQPGDDGVLVSHELRIEPDRRRVLLAGAEVPVTFLEFELLHTLAAAPGRVFTRDMLLQRVWGDAGYRDPRTIDVHVRHVREKLEPDPKVPEYVLTVRGVGYRFRDRA